MKEALPWINTGVGAVTSATGAYAQYQRGQMEKQAYEYNAQVAEEESRQQQTTSERKYAELMGRQRSLYGKAGVDITTGSPLLVLADTAMQERLEAQRIQAAGKSEAAMQRYYGRMAAYGANVGAMTTFMTGLGKTAMEVQTLLNR